MKNECQQPKGREGATEELNTAIKATNLAESLSAIAPAKIAFGSVGVLLTVIKVCFLLLRNDLLRSHHSQDSMVDEPDCVELGLFCTDICRALDRGTNGKQPDELSQPIYGAISQLSV